MFELKLLGGKKEQITTATYILFFVLLRFEPKKNLNLIIEYNHNYLGFSNLHLQMDLAALYCLPVQKLCELLLKLLYVAGG